MFEIIPMTHSRSFRSPFREMDLLARAFFDEPFFSEKAKIVPFKTDVRKTENGYLLEAELPGFNKEEIAIALEGDVLTIKAEHKEEEKEEKDDKTEKFVRIERNHSSFERRFDVSEIDTDKIDAKYENGILILNMPTREPVAPPSRQIAVG